MERILRGIMRYRNTTREQMVKEFQRVRDNPEPKAVFFTCMDSRMIPTRYTDTHVGDMFVVRNAGNLIPHAHHFQDEHFSCEPAALELGCLTSVPRNCKKLLDKRNTRYIKSRSGQFLKVLFSCRSASSASLVKPWENVGIVKGVPQSSNLSNNELHVQQHYSSQQSQPSPSLHIPLVPRHEKSRPNPIELRLSGADETNSITNNNNNNIYQHLGAHNSKSVNEINLAEARNALDRGMLRTDLPSKYGNRVNALNLCHEACVKIWFFLLLLRGTMAVPLSEEHNLGGSAEIMFPPTTATSNENLLDIFNGNSSQLYKFNNSLDDLYKQATTISANGALVPPPYRDPPPPRNSPLQLNTVPQVAETMLSASNSTETLAILT
uniref:carbonic anhydrase n=1 Tax=Glossina palpalis gambiensis TaxID=67801 RepID=A0A1B0BFD9_9MUSC